MVVHYAIALVLRQGVAIELPFLIHVSCHSYGITFPWPFEPFRVKFCFLRGPLRILTAAKNATGPVGLWTSEFECFWKAQLFINTALEVYSSVNNNDLKIYIYILQITLDVHTSWTRSQREFGDRNGQFSPGTFPYPDSMFTRLHFINSANVLLGSHLMKYVNRGQARMLSWRREKHAKWYHHWNILLCWCFYKYFRINRLFHLHMLSEDKWNFSALILFNYNFNFNFI